MTQKLRRLFFQRLGSDLPVPTWLLTTIETPAAWDLMPSFGLSGHQAQICMQAKYPYTQQNKIFFKNKKLKKERAKYMGRLWNNTYEFNMLKKRFPSHE